MAQGRESSRVAQIKVLDLALHPGLSPTDLVSLSPDRRYRYEIERSKLELQVEQAMQKKYDVTMDERTVLCEAIAISNDTNNPVLAKRIRDDCNYTATLGIAGGYYDGPRAYNLQIQFLISPGGAGPSTTADSSGGPLPQKAGCLAVVARVLRRGAWARIVASRADQGARPDTAPRAQCRALGIATA